MQLIYWLLAIILGSSAAFWVYLADKRRAVPYPWLTALLRGLVILAVVLLVLVPDIIINRNTTEQPIILLLQDNSRSAGIAMADDSVAYHKQMEALADRLKGKYKVVQWGFGDQVQQDSIYVYNQSATDISAALSRAEERYGMQNLGAIVLATDGRFNQGINPAYRQSGYQGALYTIALGDSTRKKDMSVSRTYANKTATINTSFEIRADIIAELCRGYSNSAILKEGDELLSSSSIQVNTDRFDRTVSFTVKATKAGLHHYVLTVPPAEGETNVTNNRRDIFVEVIDEKKEILIAAAAPHPDVNAIKEALSSLESYKVTVCNADNFPASLNQYNAIILHGLPSVKYRIAATLEAARKPLWFILSSRSDVLAINGMKQITHTSISPAQPHDMPLAYHTAFNAFTVPQRIQAVSDKMPPLLAYTGNIMAAPGANVLFTQRTPAGTMPAWVMQHGSVPTAILAGEGIWQWRMHEFKNFDEHNVIDECIRQTVAYLCNNTSDRPFNAIMPKHIWSDQEPVSITAYLLNANNEQINTSDVVLTVADSGGRSQEYSFERSGTGYNLNIGIRAGGRYTYTAKTNYNSKTLTATGSFVVESIPLELMETGADYSMLYNLAHDHNGAFVTTSGIPSLYDSILNNKIIKPIIQTNTETVPLIDRKWYFIIILILAVAEWLIRKYWLAQ
jgi:hypothetical protein